MLTLLKYHGILLRGDSRKPSTLEFLVPMAVGLSSWLAAYRLGDWIPSLSREYHIVDFHGKEDPESLPPSVDASDLQNIGDRTTV